MIASLVPLPDMSPVPRVEVRLESIDLFDGGTAEETGEEILDGGDAEATGSTADGGPAAQFSVELPDGTDRVTVWSTVDGIAYKVQGVVEEAINAEIGMRVLDHAAPPNASSSYSVECFAGDDPLGTFPLGSTFLPWEGPLGHVLIQNPLNPRLHALVKNMAGSWPEITRDAPGDLVWTEGAELPDSVGWGPRRGIEPLAVDFEVPDRATAARMWATLGTKDKPQLPIWLIRSPNPGLMPKVFYGRVGPLREIDRGVGRSKGQGGGGRSRFRAALTQTKQPVPGVVAPSLRYSDLKAVFPTYSEMRSALPTYSQMASAWEYAGASGED